MCKVVDRTAATYLILVSWQMIYSQEITGRPGVVGTTTGGTIDLAWSFSVRADSNGELGLYFGPVSSGNQIMYLAGAAVVQTIEAYMDRLTHTFTGNTITFHLADVNDTDTEHTFACQASFNATLRDEGAQVFIFKVPADPVIAVAPTGDIVENVTVTLTCSATSNSIPASHRPTMEYTWERNGAEIDPGDPPDSHSVIPPNQLRISRVHRSDETYVCTAKEQGSIYSRTTTTQLNVLYGPYHVMLNPPSPLTVAENDDVSVTCTADCRPVCEYTWRRGEQQLSTNGQLMLDNFQQDQQDVYICIANNTINGRVKALEETMEINIGDPTNIGLIVGVSVGGVLLIVVVAVILAVLHRRRKLMKKNKDGKPGYGTTEKGTPKQGQADNASVDDELMPYGTSSNTRSIQRTAVNNDHDTAEPALYSKVDKTQKKKNGKLLPSTLNASDGQKKNNNKDEHHPEPIVYAQVNKKNKASKPNAQMSQHNKEEQNNRGARPYVNARHNDMGQEEAYAEISPNVAPTGNPDENNTYQNAGKTSMPFDEKTPYANVDSINPAVKPKVAEGTMYAELAFNEDPPVKPKVIHRKEEPTEYAPIDFTKKATPNTENE